MIRYSQPPSIYGNRSYYGPSAGSKKPSSRGWGRVKTRLDIKSLPPAKKPEMEFRNLVMKLAANKSEAKIEAMEKRLRKVNNGPRQKTEFELMKERLRHVEFSDEEKGFLTKEQMETISNKIGETKKKLMELERDLKSKGKLLGSFILEFEEWNEEVEFLKTSGLEIDLDSLLQARKRILVRDLFYDPLEAERRRKAAEEAERLARLREAELEQQRKEAEEERLKALEAEKERLRLENEAIERKLREEEEKRLAEKRREEENLKMYAEQEKRRLELEELKRLKFEEETRAKRAGMLRKFSTADMEAPDLTEVGKLNFDGFGEGDFKSRRRSVGKLQNPWEAGQPAASKPRTRRVSKVGKLNTTFEVSGDGNPSWSKASSRSTSKNTSRRGSTTDNLSSTGTTPITEQKDFLEALSGLENLAARAKESKEDEF